MRTDPRDWVGRYPKSLAYIIVCVTIIIALQVVILLRG